MHQCTASLLRLQKAGRTRFISLKPWTTGVWFIIMSVSFLSVFLLNEKSDFSSTWVSVNNICMWCCCCSPSERSKQAARFSCLPEENEEKMERKHSWKQLRAARLMVQIFRAASLKTWTWNSATSPSSQRSVTPTQDKYSGEWWMLLACRLGVRRSGSGPGSRYPAGVTDGPLHHGSYSLSTNICFGLK